MICQEYLTKLTQRMSGSDRMIIKFTSFKMCVMTVLVAAGQSYCTIMYNHPGLSKVSMIMNYEVSDKACTLFKKT